jgi:hypothetical protein
MISRLVPTSCVRACTAAPTEISFNYSDDPEQAYAAEVEFITRKEWIAELQVLVTSVKEVNDMSEEAITENSSAGIAKAKLNAVYPDLDDESISSSTVTSLAKEPCVAQFLGTVQKLQATSALELHRQLQGFVNSKEKGTHKETELWPLIRVIRIYTKSSALSTGAVIVDLVSQLRTPAKKHV